MKTPLNLRQVECFFAAADAGTMTAAAERLGVSQSAVSLAISGLEASIGSQLMIRRRSQGLALTALGREFFAEARELLALAEEVRDSVEAGGRTVTGHLVVGCFLTAAPFLLPALIESFTAVHPEVKLDFVEGSVPDIDAALREGRCEIAIVYDLDVPSHLALNRLYEVRPYVLLHPEHPVAGRDEVALADLQTEDMILIDVPPSAPYLLGIFERAGYVPRVRYRTRSYELVRSLVGRGLGFALLLSRPAVDLTYEGLPVVARPLAEEPEPVGVSLAWLASARLTRRAQAFAAHCRDALPDFATSAFDPSSGPKPRL